MQALGTTLVTLHTSLTTAAFLHKHENKVWVKEWTVELLKPLSRGPFTILLSTPMAPPIGAHYDVVP